MNKLIFARALKRVLLSRLPQDGGYQWSNKIEGMLIRSEESTAFDKVVFVIDTALTPEQLLLLSHETYMVIRKNSTLRASKYNYLICRKDGVDNTRIIRGRWSSAIHVLEAMDALRQTQYVCDGNPDGENILTECEKCFRFGQIIVFTTEAKVKMLKTISAKVRKKTIIVYAADTATTGIERLAGVYALGLEQDEVEGDAQ